MKRICSGRARYSSSKPGAYEWHQAFKIGSTYFLSIEVGVSSGKRWRPVIAVSKDPATGWTEIDVDAGHPAQSGEGLYRGMITDLPRRHAGAFYQVGSKWSLNAQACPPPGNSNT